MWLLGHEKHNEDVSSPGATFKVHALQRTKKHASEGPFGNISNLEQYVQHECHLITDGSAVHVELILLLNENRRAFPHLHFPLNVTSAI